VKAEAKAANKAGQLAKGDEVDVPKPVVTRKSAARKAAKAKAAEEAAAAK
jgi:hypothetical protein